MHSKTNSHPSILGLCWDPANATLAIMIVLLFLIFLIMFMTLTAQPAQGQEFNLLHTFSGGADGANPFASPTLDTAGNLYGTTYYGGLGYGMVFKLTHKPSGWVMTQPYVFKNGDDGGFPSGPVVFGPDGNLYGAMGNGIFKLQPPVAICKTVMCPWTETVLYHFSGGPGGSNPFDKIVFDSSGNIYGITGFGGDDACQPGFGCGVVYRLRRTSSGWTEDVLYAFTGGSDGKYPDGGLVLDAAGNLFGVAVNGGAYNRGVVFELMPSNGQWTEVTLHAFEGSDGILPMGDLMQDSLGNLYGTTNGGGQYSGGTVFELTPHEGGWDFAVVYSFAYSGGPGPEGGVVMDSAGNLYGTAYFAEGGRAPGEVFELTLANGIWIETVLHTFTGADGAFPTGGVAIDAQRNIYGTAGDGGNITQNCNLGCGTVWQIIR